MIQSSSRISLFFGIFNSAEKWPVNIRFPLPLFWGKKSALTLYRRKIILISSLMSNRNNRKLKITVGASQVAQWLRICLPMQGTRVRALVWEDPTCHGATGPVSHNYWACASGACAPQQERPRWWEARAPRWRVAPTCHNWRKPSHRNEDPTQP